jgi:head-tail adaptor
MTYSSGFLKDRITILNRKEAQQGKFGLDSAGIEFEPAACLHANVDWQKGKTAMNAGALDAYGVKIVRMRWNNIVTERSRIQWHGKTYQILQFHDDQRENIVQIIAQETNEQLGKEL